MRWVGLQAVAWAPDGERLMSASYDDTLRCWEPDADGEVPSHHCPSILTNHYDSS